MSTTASDVERGDGSSKSAEVQAAPGTRSISVGRFRRRQAAAEAFRILSEKFFVFFVFSPSPICMSRGDASPPLFLLLCRPAGQGGQRRRAGHHRVHARARHGCDRLQALQVETLVQVVFFCVAVFFRCLFFFLSMCWTSLAVLSPDPAAAARRLKA